MEREVQNIRGRLTKSAVATEQDLLLYEDAALFVLFDRYQPRFYDAIVQASARNAVRTAGASTRVRSRLGNLLSHSRYHLARTVRCPAPLCVLISRSERAFHHIIESIIGSSMAAARLRAAVWQSIFTHDMRRYRRTLYDRLGDFTTLIRGPSGTGKELVASAIGLSRYIPFDPKTQTFSEDFASSFSALNLSALPSTLVESELFGHRRGAFTGALHDRRGWLEVCPPLGAVFLDEIGDLDAAIQVKLLRVLQSRTFQALGDTTERHFRGN